MQCIIFQCNLVYISEAQCNEVLQCSDAVGKLYLLAKALLGDKEDLSNKLYVQQKYEGSLTNTF